MKNASNKYPTWLRWLVLFVAVALALTLFDVVKAHAACQTSYPYAGCTAYQMRQQEAGTVHTVRRHYDRHRWGQSHREFAGMPRHANRVFRRKYNVAVDRYTAKRGASVYVYRAPVEGWSAFKADAKCWGNTYAETLKWCQMGQLGWDRQANDLKRFAVKCGGDVVVGVFVGGVVGGVPTLGVGVIPGAIDGGLTGLGDRVGHMLWDAIWGV